MTLASAERVTRRGIGIAGALAALAGTPVGAQLTPERQLGSRIPVAPRPVAVSRGGQLLRDFARCILQRNQAGSTALIVHSDPATVDLRAAGMDEKTVGKTLHLEDCLGQQMNADDNAMAFQFSPVRLRSLLQEEAYLAAHPVAPTPPPAMTEAIGRTFVSGPEDLPRAKALAAFADCLSFADPINADALVRATAGSVAEQAALAAITPSLGKCVVQGQSVKLNRATVRAFAADGLWTRYSQGNPVMATNSAK
jgi:hypothetical protein